MKVQRMMVSFGVFWLGLALGQPVVGLADTQKPEDLVTVNYWIRASNSTKPRDISFYVYKKYQISRNQLKGHRPPKELDFLLVTPKKDSQVPNTANEINWVYDTEVENSKKNVTVHVRYYYHGVKVGMMETIMPTIGGYVIPTQLPREYKFEGDGKYQILKSGTVNIDVPVTSIYDSIDQSEKPNEENLNNVKPAESEKTKPTDSTGTKPENPAPGKPETQTPEPDQSVIVEPEATVKPNHSNTGENETAKPDSSNQSSSDGTKPTGNQPTGTVDKESHGQATATGKQPAGQPEKPKPEEPAQVTPLPAPSITNGGALDKGTPSNKQPQQPTKKPTEGTKPGDSSHRPAPVAQQPPVVSRPLVETNSTVAPLPVTAEPEKPIVTVPHVPVRLPHTSPLAHQEAPLLPDNVPAKRPTGKLRRPQMQRRTPDKTDAVDHTNAIPTRPSLPDTHRPRLPQTNEATNSFHWGGLVLLVTLMGSALTRRIRR